MDHLPIPEEYRERAWKVRYLGLVKYDGAGFEGFPERLGIDQSKLLEGNLEGHTRDYAESALQEWLFFAVLHEFSKACEVPLDLTEFIKTNPDGTRYVSSEPFIQYLNKVGEIRTQLVRNQQGLLEHLEKVFNRSLNIADTTSASRFFFNREHLVECQRSIYLCLATAGGFIENLASRGPGVDTLPLCRETLLSFAILYIGLDSASNFLFGIRDCRSESLTITHNRFIVVFLESMKQNGWCVHRTSGVLPNDLVRAYRASLLPSHSSGMHPNCVDEKCCETSLGVYHMGPTHCKSCCGNSCPLLSIDGQKLVDVLDSGGYPAIACSETTPLSLKVVDASQVHSYIAISHVSSHGLGNPLQNALPSCQIKRLFDLILSLDLNDCRDPVLWIDTLCVPLTARSHRSLAISRLRKTYSEASKVFVLDDQLQQVRGDIWEQRFRVLCSEWMGRLWTLQGDLLAKDLFFQFMDHAISLKDLLDPDVRVDSPYLLYDWSDASISFLERRFLRSSAKDDRLLALVSNMAARTTTKIADESVCLATLMNLEPRSFSGLTMAEVYSVIPNLPQDLVFANGPRLTKKAFRWAPSSFLQTSPTSYPNVPDYGYRVRLGLLVIKKSIQLHSTFVVESRRFVLQDPREPRGTPTFFFYITLSSGDRTQREIRSPALILQKAPSRYEGTTEAILVSNISVQGPILLCHFEFNAMVIEKRPGDGVDLFDRPGEPLLGEYCEERAWCVD